VSAALPVGLGAAGAALADAIAGVVLVRHLLAHPARYPGGALGYRSTGPRHADPVWSALLATFVYRLCTFWLPIVPALALLPSVHRLQHTLPQAPHRHPDADEGFSFRRSEERVPMSTSKHIRRLRRRHG
jgi:hypothetical protein